MKQFHRTYAIHIVEFILITSGAATLGGYGIGTEKGAFGAGLIAAGIVIHRWRREHQQKA